MPDAIAGTAIVVVARSVAGSYAAGFTEAFAWTFTVITVGMSAGSACSGMIIQSESTQAAFLAAGGSGLACAAFRLPVRRHR